MAAAVNGVPSLNTLLLERMAAAGIRSQKAATVMAPHRDPYRMEKYRPEAEWLAESIRRIEHRPVHVRGLHYAAIDTRLPTGNPYTNTEKSYEWMQDKPAKAARWLGLVPWTDIIDKKNDEPRVSRFEAPEPQPCIQLGSVEVEFPDDLAPTVWLSDYHAVQRFKLVIFAEKAAVEHVVAPLAERYGCDTYLMAGEISDTHLYRMAEVGAEDGRPMIVLTLSDADPAGYWMPSTIAYKLAALRDGWFPGLRFEVHPIGFLPEQVHAINANSPRCLPSSPLKDGERRGGAWEQKFGIQQVELDAIATLRPDVLRTIVRDGIRSFYDDGLEDRVRAARGEWEVAAQAALEEQLGRDVLDRMRADAEAKLAGLCDLVDDLNHALWIDTARFLLPDPPPIPEPSANGVPSPLASSAMEFAEFIERLKARAAYAKPDQCREAWLQKDGNVEPAS
jgi:hypothetical protein